MVMGAGWLLLLALGSTPAAEALEKGRVAVAALHFDVALSALDRGLASGSADASTLAQLHALRGQVLASTGHPEDATEAYQRALLLSPTLSLPPGSSPRLRAVLTDARVRLGNARLDFELQSKATSAQTVQTTLAVRGDVLRVVARAEVVHGAEVTPFAPTTPWLVTWRCALGPCAFFVRVLDEHGNEVRALGSQATPLLTPGFLEPRAAVKPLSTSRPLFARPWPYWVLGGLAAGVGTYFAVSFTREQAALQRGVGNSQTPAATLTQLDVSRRRDQVGTYVALGAAGALGVTGLVLVF